MMLYNLVQYEGINTIVLKKFSTCPFRQPSGSFLVLWVSKHHVWRLRCSAAAADHSLAAASGVWSSGRFVATEKIESDVERKGKNLKTLSYKII